MDKKEKERRKQIRNELRQKQQEEFEKNLPMERTSFKELFDCLDDQLRKMDCDNTNKLTTGFLEKNTIINVENVLSWLAENGGYCDCEILANVEQKFEK